MKISLTKREIDLINRMAAIGSASPWGEGDYSDWTEEDSPAFDSLRQKIWKAIDSSNKKGAN